MAWPGTQGVWHPQGDCRHHSESCCEPGERPLPSAAPPLQCSGQWWGLPTFRCSSCPCGRVWVVVLTHRRAPCVNRQGYYNFILAMGLVCVAARVVLVQLTSSAALTLVGRCVCVGLVWFGLVWFGLCACLSCQLRHCQRRPAGEGGLAGGCGGRWRVWRLDRVFPHFVLSIHPRHDWLCAGGAQRSRCVCVCGSVGNLWPAPWEVGSSRVLLRRWYVQRTMS